MFTVTVGTNARTHGICCLAIGDNTLARGAYQVSIGEKITIPNELTKSSAVATLTEIKELKLTFNAMVEQKFAPPNFGVEAAKALDLLASTLEKHFGKNLEGLVEDLKKEVVEEKSAGEENAKQ